MVSTGDVRPGADWQDVTRRYRRGPGGWWWLALLLVPLLLAVLGGLILGPADGDPEGPAAPASTGSTDEGAGTSEPPGDGSGATTGGSAQTSAAGADAEATSDTQTTVDPSLATADGCAQLEAEAASLLETSPVTFASGASELTDESRAVVNQLAVLIASCADATVEVGGHSDDTGSETLNEQLSQARAQAVVEALVQEGIPEERLTAQGYGAEEPVAPNDTEAGRAANRRVEITITEGAG